MTIDSSIYFSCDRFIRLHCTCRTWKMIAVFSLVLVDNKALNSVMIVKFFSDHFYFEISQELIFPYIHFCRCQKHPFTFPNSYSDAKNNFSMCIQDQVYQYAPQNNQIEMKILVLLAHGLWYQEFMIYKSSFGLMI